MMPQRMTQTLDEMTVQTMIRDVSTLLDRIEENEGDPAIFHHLLIAHQELSLARDKMAEMDPALDEVLVLPPVRQSS